MCGICGVLTLDGSRVSRSVVENMARTLIHRGPDESGSYVEDSLGLGHTRLRIIDLSRAAGQPMTNEDGSLRVVFNGEIYNYRETGTTLKALGHLFRSNSDTEVILHLYEEKLERCVEELDGMFAFALWDARRRRLLLARDRAGKKPLYYYKDHKLFVFASEIKSLFRHPGVPLRVDRSRIPSYFIHGYVPTPATFYDGISSLDPGHTLTVEAGGKTQLMQYWDLSFPEARSYDKAFSPERNVAGSVRELVTEAVRKRLIADVPLGAFLSGGIDSTIVVGVMSRLLKEQVKTFSIGFAGDKAFDETRYARLASRHFETDHTEFIVEPKAIDLLEALVWYHDGPFGDPSGIPTYIVSRLSRDHVTVALSGDGGDEMFAGYLRFSAGTIAERIPTIVVKGGNLMLSVLPEPTNYHSFVRRAQRFFQGARIPFYERFSRWISLFYDDLDVLLRREVLEDLGEIDRIGHFRRHLAKISGYTPLSKLLYLNFKTYLLDDLLVKMDRCTMANSLETRSPFLDRALVEYTAAMPDQLKLRRGDTKRVLKMAFADLLPSEILTRGKMGFGVPLGAWFRGDLRDYMMELLLSSESRLREYLRQEYVERLVREHLERRRDHGHRLWAILSFEVWLRRVGSWKNSREAGVSRVPFDLSSVGLA